jgi:hypothetical protein
MIKSLLNGLAVVGRKPPFSVKEGFQTHPGSIKEMLRIIDLPRPDLNKLEYRNVYEFTVADAQGLAYAYANTWFFTSQRRIYPCEIEGEDLYRPTAIRRMKYISLGDVVTAAGLNKNDYDHIGDVAYFRGMLFVPVRHTSEKPPHVLFCLSENLEVIAFAKVVESTDSWCAVNPWNQALYMPDAKDASRLNAYDISSILDISQQRDKWGYQHVLKHLHSYMRLKQDGSPDTFGSQGCCFSANGRMYLTSAKKHALTLRPDTWDNYVYVYDTLTGVRLSVRKTDFRGDYNEIEGISIHPSGVIYIAVADNDASTDEFKIYAFRFSNDTPV